MVLTNPFPLRLSPPVKAACLLLFACVFFASMNAIIRYVSADVEPLEIVFFRNLFGLLAMMPWLARRGLGVMRTERLGMIMMRSFWGFLSMAAWFSALAIVPLANAVALSFTSPLFAAIAAVLLLGEVIRARRITALAVGFAGTLVILRPGVDSIGWGEMLVLASTVTMALSIVTMKALTRTERSSSLVVWQTLLIAPISLVPALFVWSWPSPETWFWLIVLGIFASIAHVAFTRAFSLADTTYLMPFDYSRLPIVALLGWIVFGEVTDIWTWVGAAIIAASSVYVANREALARRRDLASGAMTASAEPVGEMPQPSGELAPVALETHQDGDGADRRVAGEHEAHGRDRHAEIH
jgi:drug/metabolite transporter (DMT)-like permease